MEKKKNSIEKDESSYTPQENQFADGKGTLLNEEIAPDRGDIEDELAEEGEEIFEEEKFVDEKLDEDFEKFKDKENWGSANPSNYRKS